MADELLRPLREKYAANEKISRHLKGMLDHMVDNLDSLRAMGQPPHEGQVPGMIFMAPPPEIVFHPYQVNLLVDNSEMEGPRSFSNPIPHTAICSEASNASWTGQAYGIRISPKSKPVRLSKPTAAILSSTCWTPSWSPRLANAEAGFETSEIEIQTFDPFYFVTTHGREARTPFLWRVKVVVLADPRLYQILQYYDPDVAKIFRCVRILRALWTRTAIRRSRSSASPRKS